MKIDLDALEVALQRQWWTADQLAAHFHVSRAKLHDRLAELALRQTIFATGRGVRGFPKRYRICAVARNVKVLA